MDNLDLMYDEKFFIKNYRDHNQANLCFGNFLYEYFKPKSVVDFGCAIGNILYSFKERGCDICGIEGSTKSRKMMDEKFPGVSKYVKIKDISLPIKLEKKYDLAISMETLEHIRPQFSDNAVESIALSSDLLVLTACPPVGRNKLHFNEQKFDYWIKKFRKHNFCLNIEHTNEIKKYMRRKYDEKKFIVPAWFFSRYIGCFTKG